MEVGKLSKEDLLRSFEKLVRTERKITARVLQFIDEIESRKLYLEMAYPSLFDYLIKAHGYSPSSAMRRISAARLLREVPEVVSGVESGDLNLTQLNLAQKAIKLHQNESGQKLSAIQKKNLLAEINGATQKQTEIILAQELSLPLPVDEKQSFHRDESVTLTVTFSKEQLEVIEEARDLISHSVVDGKWSDVIVFLAKKEIQRRTSNQLPQRQSTSSSAVKKANLQKNKSCQYRDPRTGKICGGKIRLQSDHIKPKWAGGDDDPKNLTALCALHNRMRYRKQAGLKSPS